MNDVTFILPLPTGTEPVLFRAADSVGDGLPLLPKALVDQVIDIPANPGVLGDVYADLQLVAARFDLCDRATAEACADTENGRFRLVFQPITQGQAFDLGFHVFYEVPKADIPAIVGALRDLSTQLALPLTSPLQVNPKVGVDAAYTDALRSLLAARCASRSCSTYARRPGTSRRRRARRSPGSPSWTYRSRRRRLRRTTPPPSCASSTPCSPTAKNSRPSGACAPRSN